jgi:hypothetical protein
MACVAPAVMVISLPASYRCRYSASIFALTASRSACTPGIGGYWFRPSRIAEFTASTRRASQSKSGKPCPRLIAPCSAASADITLKIVVPTWGRRLASVSGVAVVMMVDQSS